MKVEKELETLQHSLIDLANSDKDYNDVVDNIYKRREENGLPSVKRTPD